MCIVSLLWSLMATIQVGPASTVKGIVQVAVNYGPHKNVFLSGVVVGDGRTVLTDGSVFASAREITVSYPDGELADAIMPQVQAHGSVGVLPLPEKHGETVSLASRQTIASEEISAFAGGAPKAFASAQMAVRLRPLAGSNGPRRWQVTPALPAYYRGGPLLDREGRLLGLLVQEGEGRPLVGLALDSVSDMIAVSAATPPAVPRGPSESAKPSTPSPRELVPVVADLNLPIPPPATGWIWTAAALPPASKPSRTPVATPDQAPVQNVEAAPVTENLIDEVAGLIRGCNEKIQKQEYPVAVTCFEEALRLHPDQAPLHYHAAFAYWYKAMHNPDGKKRSSMEKGSYRSALKEFERFLEKAPDDPRAADARIRLDLLRSAQYGYRPKSK